ncbi:LPXTG cell wall anchor domain-containing protein [Streptomyces sp. PSKA30]|uniref:LPXTG cell wall anchor domain-containing protein n=1 Tax=Streptomyces sp. PSKA30 TaxID=2874597 RepID=UPI001CD0F3C5|nr:LPXTG cell wall anchor domain-containing protein [Streptomyces sp. PSKA30]MBZ9639702.1 LPXTG cell wall anchor domain-containing protein [Streptomyces sp. PSKA30]
MKLRRALAAAAATAAIAPMALLAAPAAYATEDTGSASPSVTATESATDTPTEEPSATATETATETATATPTESAPETPTDEPSATATETATETATATPTGSASASASATPSPSASTPEEEPDLCENADDESVGLSEDLRSGLSGLPETIVAGSGWTGFSFNVSNSGDEEIKNIKPLIGVAALGWDEQDYSGQITVQVYDKATGSWKTLADAAGEGATFDAFSLGAGQSTSYKLRLSVSGKVPDAIGLTGGFAQYSDADGCWLADDPNGWVYFFDILAAGSDAGNPGDAKPQGGMADLDDVNSVDATGSLANTGSNSTLPMIGLVGGVAVVAGAGAVFVVRRNKAGAQA